ncbi:hypothetical protein GLYMA_08G359800v4 [Glycine max]|uniref:Uncharacterized protein n=1 Tax=Glycine max TaxID=3847 RepID=A0A0R0J341_SOYBN|nr:hypothetical protein GYH30_023488 [Glycine max]KRH46841.1 hypothetical protein GLYMA_08G359800v4 [Glycine max]
MQICAYLFSTLPHLYQTCATATPPLILCNHRHLCQIRVTTAPLSKPCHRCTFANPLRPPHLRQTRATTAPPSVLCNHRRPSSICWCLVVTTLSNGGWWFLVGMLRTFAWTLMGGYGVLL